MADVEWSRDNFDLSDFEARTSTEVADDEFTTVEVIEVEKGEGVAIGQGTSTNPLQAEGFAEGELVDGGGNELTGKFQLQILNSQNNPARGGMVFRNRIEKLSRTRSNGPDGIAVPYTDKEVYEPYKLALRLRLDDGTATYDSAASSLSIDGWAGEVMG